MAFSIAEVAILCLLAAWLCRAVRMPGLIGMLLVGVVCGSSVLGLLDERLLAVSADLRLGAMIIILLRAGFELSRKVLHRVSGKVLLLACVPAVVEGVAITLLGPWLLGLTVLESAILGAIVAAVSPAVVVPMMVRYITERRGAEKGIPTMILAATSLDDVFVIVAAGVLVGLYTGSETHLVWRLAGIPLGIALGIAVGLLLGIFLVWCFERFNPRATKRALIVVALGLLLVRLERFVEAWVPFAALVATMAIGFMILEKRERMAHEISGKLGRLWVFAELVLFAMVGAAVDLDVAWSAGLMGAALIGLGLLARAGGTWLCLLGSDLDRGERLFVAVAYCPKATVQAAIGAMPLIAMQQAGMAEGPGQVILAVAVLSIVLTAPTGAWAMALLGKRVLKVAPEEVHDAADAAAESAASELGETG